jgi:hypothetical protein
LFEGKESVCSSVVNLLNHVINNEDNDQLTASFYIEEFKEAMFNLTNVRDLMVTILGSINTFGLCVVMIFMMSAVSG